VNENPKFEILLIIEKKVIEKLLLVLKKRKNKPTINNKYTNK
tara:strand:+ start:490 stop:615 length:126 start_codon:yes stop_codon:yes gene_type:complete